MPDEEDAYDEKSVEEMKENDEVSSEEEAFMEGFTEDVEETETDPEDYFTTEKKTTSSVTLDRLNSKCFQFIR